MPRMIGRHCPDGPGGIKCECCRQHTPRARAAARRRVKRSERQRWKRTTRTTV